MARIVLPLFVAVAGGVFFRVRRGFASFMFDVQTVVGLKRESGRARYLRWAVPFAAVMGAVLVVGGLCLAVAGVVARI